MHRMCVTKAAKYVPTRQLNFSHLQSLTQRTHSHLPRNLTSLSLVKSSGSINIMVRSHSVVKLKTKRSTKYVSEAESKKQRKQESQLVKHKKPSSRVTARVIGTTSASGVTKSAPLKVKPNHVPDSEEEEDDEEEKESTERKSDNEGNSDNEEATSSAAAAAVSNRVDSETQDQEEAELYRRRPRINVELSAVTRDFFASSLPARRRVTSNICASICSNPAIVFPSELSDNAAYYAEGVVTEALKFTMQMTDAEKKKKISARRFDSAFEIMCKTRGATNPVWFDIFNRYRCNVINIDHEHDHDLQLHADYDETVDGRKLKEARTLSKIRADISGGANRLEKLKAKKANGLATGWNDNGVIDIAIRKAEHNYDKAKAALWQWEKDHPNMEVKASKSTKAKAAAAAVAI